METKTARHRSTETRQGRAVRWLVGQREVASEQRRTTETMEQAELWPSTNRTQRHEATPVCEATAPVEDTAWASPEEQFDVEPQASQPVMASIPAPPARPATLSRRFVTRSVKRQATTPAKPGQRIARFLNVNNAIKAFDYHEDFNRYQQPESGLSKMFRFFKGSASAGHYTSLFF